MRRPLAALALAVTLSVGVLTASPAFAGGNGSGSRAVVLEIWDTLRAGWWEWWRGLAEAHSEGRLPDSVVLAIGGGMDPNGRESVTSEYGGGMDPNGRCDLPACPPPPAAQASTDDPGL